MEITEVRIKLTKADGVGLQAYCSITFDGCFVVRDLKIIAGPDGLFVAMPSRKLTALCPQCGMKNRLRSAFCNTCGRGQNENHLAMGQDGRAKLYADIAHPINSACREMIQQCVIREYQFELNRVKPPGFVSYTDRVDDEPTPPTPHRATASGKPFRSGESYGPQPPNA